MARWSNENAFDAAVRVAAQNYAVPFELVKAVIGQESRFNPRATRIEAALADRSVGLMQILYATAKGEGYTGPLGDPASLTGLYDPLTNITYGTSFLASMLAQTHGHIPSAVSAYNGGYRPTIGFGALATKPMTICLRRDAQGRCVETKQVSPGQYSNQEYVNNVLSNFDYFRSLAAQPPSTVGGKASSVPLGDAHQYHVEPETGGRVGRAVDRTVWTQIWEAIIALCNRLFRHQTR